MKSFNWDANCKEERLAVIGRLEAVLNSFAHILDFQSFSDLSINITISVEEWRIEALYDELTKMMEMRLERPLANTEKKECMLHLKIRFINRKLEQNSEISDFME